jgi:preprotein translocase subunit SecD
MLLNARVAGALALSLWAVSLALAAVKFEVRRAERKPAEGLTEAKVEGTDEKVYLHKEVELTNEDIAGAKAVTDQSKANVVEVELTKEGRQKLARLTKAHQGKPLAILVDGKVVAAPVVRDEFTGNARISGNFSKEKAERIAKGIKGK